MRVCPLFPSGLDRGPIAIAGRDKSLGVQSNRVAIPFGSLDYAGAGTSMALASMRAIGSRGRSFSALTIERRARSIWPYA